MPERVLASPPFSKLARRWFGSAAAERPDGAANGEGDVARLAREGRRELLEQISTFLIEHDLAVTADNLVFAWAAYSGASPNLMRKIAETSHGGHKVAQQWINENAPPPVGDDKRDREARELLDHLGNSVRQFTSSTSAVRTATSEYNHELDQHVAELVETAEASDTVRRLASIAKRMAERTRKMEVELKASEQEAKALRRRLDKAKRDADQDHLTGLPNRRAFEIEFERQYAEAFAAREPLSIAFCDIDHFKLINDQHGHDAGDRVLKMIAQVLAASSMDNCHVSRHGGEEFVLLFRGLSPAEAKGKLDRAREDLSTRRMLNKETGQPYGSITFSAGVANVFAHADPRAALKAADGALYQAKESGRNQVLIG